jgi:hypothetical protein
MSVSRSQRRLPKTFRFNKWNEEGPRHPSYPCHETLCEVLFGCRHLWNFVTKRSRSSVVRNSVWSDRCPQDKVDTSETWSFGQWYFCSYCVSRKFIRPWSCHVILNAAWKHYPLRAIVALCGMHYQWPGRHVSEFIFILPFFFYQNQY